ncbi:MAG: preprotein translocase subunit SecE [Porticoccaceae bacterium]
MGLPVSAVADNRSRQLEWLKWLAVTLLVGGAVYANYHFKAESLLYRVLGLLVVAAVAALIALRTAKGEAFWELAKGAKTEAARVVWPTRQERNQTTLVVVGFILVMALLLWGLDLFFGWLTALIIG